MSLQAMFLSPELLSWTLKNKLIIYLHVQIDGETHTEVIRVSEYLPADPRPLLGYLAHLRPVPSRRDVEVNVGAALTPAQRPLYRQDLLPPLVLHGEQRRAERPLLLHVADDGARGAVDLQLLYTVWKLC